MHTATKKSFTILKESTPDRCEICHQSDMFDALLLQCDRCKEIAPVVQDLSYPVYRATASLTPANTLSRPQVSFLEILHCLFDLVPDGVRDVVLLVVSGFSFLWGRSIPLSTLITSTSLFVCITGLILIVGLVSYGDGTGQNSNVFVFKICIWGLIMTVAWYVFLLTGYLFFSSF